MRKTFKNPGLQVKSYGSHETGLLTPFSDMDLLVQGCLAAEREQVVRMLETLDYNLSLCKFVISARPIFTATVPVLKVEADPSIEYE